MLVNYRQESKEGNRFTDVQLADFGSTVHKDSGYARDGDSIGTPIFRSPEAHLQMRWGTSTDIWSFGAMVSSHTAQCVAVGQLMINSSPAYQPSIRGRVPHIQT